MENPFEGAGQAEIVRRLPGVPVETIQDYVADAWAKAMQVAPCIKAMEFPEEKVPLVKAIIRGIILRWNEAQGGAATAKMAGPYQVQLDSRPKRGFVLQPSEIVDLGKLCKRAGRPFTVDTIPDEFKTFPPLAGVVVNGNANLDGPAGEWSPDAPELDI